MTQVLLFVLLGILALFFVSWLKAVFTRQAELPPVTNFCPICTKLYDKTRRPVVYHVHYNPERVIMACQVCNEIEYLDRTDNLSARLKKIHNLRMQK